MSQAGPPHRTVSLHELHVVGPHGLPVRHRTVQVVRALQPGLPDGEGFTAVELRFPRPLRLGDRVTGV